MQTNKEKNFISAVVYIHNNQRQVFDFLNMLNSQLESTFEHFEIICVNDYSIDNSYEEISKFAAGAKGKSISIINMSFYQGMELSMNAGMDLAIGDFVYEFDYVTHSFPPAIIKEAYYHAIMGNDIVTVSPQNNKRKSYYFYKLYNYFAKSQYILCNDSFRILSRRGINRVYSMSKRILFRKAAYASCGLKMDNIKYSGNIDPVRQNGVEEREKANKRNVAINALILYTDISYRLAKGLTLSMALIALLIVFYTVTVYVTGNPVEGWTTLMLFLAISFMGIFMVLCILIKYATLILNLIFSKQKYLIESIVKLNN